MDSQNLNYLISKNKNIALYCHYCKLYYYIHSSKYFLFNTHRMCDNCFYDLLEPLYMSYADYYINKSFYKRNDDNTYHKLKKLIADFLF